jgi:leader peptidase (prepilin peptidase)/N-methyltransferase
MLFVFGAFGLIVGSFLNVFVLRRGTTLSGRSHCMNCSKQIEWYDNLPVASWLVLRGRCRHCGSRISAQYPLVEGGTALLFALIGAAPLTLPQQLVACAVVFLFLALALYDLRHTILPDEWVYPAALLCLLSNLMSGAASGSLAYVLLSGPAIAFPLFALWLLSKGRWMGLGDAKLALATGWLLGSYWGFFALTFSFILGALISLLILLPLPLYRRLFRKWGIRGSGARKSFTMKSEVPFGPFLIAGTFFLWFMLAYQVPLPL